MQQTAPSEGMNRGSAQERRPGRNPGPSSFRLRVGLIVHTAHATARHSRGPTVLLRPFGDYRFRGDQQAGDRGRVLQGATHDLGRVDDALAHHVDVVAGLGVVAKVVLVLLQDLADHDRAVFAGIDCDLARRVGQRFANDIDAVLLVLVVGLDALERLDRAEQGDAAARQNAFLDRGTGCMHRIIDAILAFLHLDLGGTAHADHRNAAGELRQPLLQLLFVVIGRRLLDLHLDLGDASLYVGFLAGAADDRSVLLFDHYLLGAAEHVQSDLVKFDAEIIADRLSAGEDRNVFEHRPAAIAEAWCFHRRNLEAAAQIVDDERGQSLALNILGDNDERLRGLHDRFEQRQQLLQARELLLVDQQIGVIHLDAHLVGIGDEVGRDVATVELHALDHIELGLERLGFLDRDHAFIADLLHRLGQKVTDFAIAVGRDGADLGDLFVGGNLLRVLLQVLDDGLDGEIDAALEIHRVHTGGDRLGAFAHDGRG